MLFVEKAPLPVTSSPYTPLRFVHVAVQLSIKAANSASVGIRHGAPRCAVAASYCATRLPVASM